MSITSMHHHNCEPRRLSLCVGISTSPVPPQCPGQHSLLWTTVRKMVAFCWAFLSLGFLTWQVYLPASLNSTLFRTMEMLLSFLVVEPTNSTRGLCWMTVGSEALFFILPW